MRSFLALLLAFGFSGYSVSQDPYREYLLRSKDFRSVKQDPEWLVSAFPSWLYIPWTHEWSIGYNDASAEWCKNHGYNGAFVDHGDVSIGGSSTGRIDWIDRHQLRFYTDHAAGKGILHLWDGDRVKPHLDELHSDTLRPHPFNESVLQNLKQTLDRNLKHVSKSPMRCAYALDDEVSWGHFVHPTMWRITDDDRAYSKWLEEIYGAARAPKRDKWVTYEDIRPQLSRWSIAEFDASPLMDQWSFNDSLWCNSLGNLVEHANQIDPKTPCGIVGGQMPSPFGGYDYAKLMRKVQFIESYNLGSSQAIIRSFNPRNAIPSVTTHFHKTVEDTIWQVWYYLAHGNRGHIGWVEKWFDGDRPKDWHAQVAPTYLEAGKKIGPLMKGVEWEDDGIAIYYNHSSIQLGWILDAEAHGKTWINRNSDERLSSAAQVRKAWENMLRDSGLQYSFLSYVDAVQTGIPQTTKVLILPACLCLSEAEAAEIRSFCQNGGTVIADYLPGVWDQHGKGRSKGGVLDPMFGVKHDGSLRAIDVFGERLWVEVDQDAHYNWTTYQEFLGRGNTCVLDDSGFHKAVRALETNRVQPYGKGKAVLMNLSPQWYNAYRANGLDTSKKRHIFLDHIVQAGVIPKVTIDTVSEAVHGYTLTHWRLPSGRRVCFVVMNPEIQGTSTGGGNSVHLKTDTTEIVLRFNGPVRNIRNERTERRLEDGETIRLNWKMNEAAVVTYDAF